MQEEIVIHLYARCSMDAVGKDGLPDEREQNPELQLGPMREEFKRRGWKIGQEFVDRISGHDKYRPDLMKLLQILRAHPNDKVGIWKLDRLSRFDWAYESEQFYYGLGKQGHEVVSFPNDQTCTNINPTDEQELLAFIAFWMASRERSGIAIRTKAGIKAKRKCDSINAPEGKHWVMDGKCVYCGKPKESIWTGGRPKGSKDSKPRVVRFAVKPNPSVEDLLTKKS